MNSLQLGQPSNSIDAAAIGVQNGTAFAMPAAASSLTWQVVLGTAPVSLTVLLQTSNDNSTWNTTDTSTATTGEIRTVSSSALFVRARVSANSGGSTVSVILVAKRITTGASLLTSLTDTNISSPSDNQVLTYSAAQSKWINQSFSIDGLIVGSTPITGGATTQVLFNDAGVLGCDAGFVYDKTADVASFGVNYADIASTQNPGIRAGSNVAGQGAAIYLGSDDANTGAPILFFYSSNGTTAAPTASTAGNLLGLITVKGRTSNTFVQSSALSFSVSSVVGSDIYGQMDVQISDAAGTTTSYLTANGTTGTVIAGVPIVLGNGLALKTDTTTAHTAVIQAYDVDGAAYSTFATLTNGNTPDFSIIPPSGGTITLQATTYKSSDGSSGIAASITTGDLVGKTAVFKDGLLVSYGA